MTAKQERQVTLLIVALVCAIWLIALLGFQLYVTGTALEDAQALLTDAYCPTPAAK